MEIKIALAQTVVARDREENRALVKEWLKEAGEKGVDFFVLPEFWTCRFNPKHKDEVTEERGGVSYTILQEAAKEYGMYVIGGSMPIWNGERAANRCFVFDRNGEELGFYDKTHMFDIETKDGRAIRESANVKPGDHMLVFDTEFGKAGVAICYDLRFPGLFVKMAEAGADFLFLPSGFTFETGSKHFLPLCKARAIDAQCFLISADAAKAEDSKVPTFGHSCVYGPWGEELFLTDEKPGLCYTTIDSDLISSARAKLPVISGQRHDLY